jgi:hypothetical protein
MHAGIRRLLLTRANPTWATRALGAPINQEDLSGTLLTFSAIILDALRRMGIAYTQQEAEAWIHTWNVLGTFLGVEPQFLTRDPDDARALMDLIQERQWAPSPDGRALTTTLIELMQSFMPTPALQGGPVAMVRHLVGDHCADLLNLPPSDWTRLLVEATDGGDAFLAEALRSAGLGKVFSAFRQAIMQGTVAVIRDGKNAPFRIPTSLTNSLDNP